MTTTTAPATRADYWVPKIEANVRRDRRNADALRRKGFSVWRVWEHDLRPAVLPTTAAVLAARLDRRLANVRIGRHVEGPGTPEADLRGKLASVGLR